MFVEAWELAGQLGLEHVLEGSQASDMVAFRPGRRALAELDVGSPLAEAGLSKPELRAVARAEGMADPEQAARPCLLTRLEYGLRPDRATLARLARAESALAVMGLADFRLRLHADGRTVLQIAAAEQVKAESLGPLLLAVLGDFGFPGASLLLSPSVSGYFDT